MGSRVDIYKQNIDETTNQQKLKREKVKTEREDIALRRDLQQLVNKRQTLNAWSNQINVIVSSWYALENDIIRDLDLTQQQRDKLKRLFDESRESVSKLEIEKFIIDEEKLLEDDNTTAA